MKYKGYTVEDFVMDTYFQQWVQNPTEQMDGFWENWLLANPSQAETVAEARVLIKNMAFGHKNMPAAKAEAIWHALEMSMSDKTITESHINNHNIKTPFIRRYIMRRHTFIGIAASIAAIILLSTGLLVYLSRTNRVSYTTAYGETREIQLPDGSIVTLNANSNLWFAKNFPETDVREVWLSGEAFFSVVDTDGRQKFIVHTDDFLQVEVLGTEFNVTKRNNKTRVVLETGKILFNIQPADRKNAKKQSLLMKPGELVEFDNASERYIKKEVNPAIYSSWKFHKLMLDNTSLQEIVQLLENTYGYQVKIASSHLLQQKVSGSIPLGNADTLLQYIAQTFEIGISRKGNSVIIHPVK